MLADPHADTLDSDTNPQINTPHADTPDTETPDANTPDTDTHDTAFGPSAPLYHYNKERLTNRESEGAD